MGYASHQEDDDRKRDEGKDRQEEEQRDLQEVSKEQPRADKASASETSKT